MASTTSLGTLSVRILANTADAETKLKRLKQAAIASFAVGSATLLAKGFSAAVSNAFQLDKQLRLLNTIAVNNGKAFDYTSKQVRDFSNLIGVDAVTAANSLYTAFSSGAESVAQAQADLAAAQDLTKTTGTDLATSVRTIAGLMNAYGSASFTATDAAAAVFEGFKDGVGSANDYAAALGKVLPTGKQLGLTIQEIASEVSASTQTLKSAPAAATGLTQAYNELAKTNTGAGKLFKDTFGHSFQEDLKKTHSGFDSIKRLLDHFGTDKVLEMFHAKGSGTAIEQLILSFPALQKALRDQAGAQADFKNATDEVNKSVSYQAQVLKNQATNALGGFGDALKPVAETWIPILTKWLTDITPHLEAFGKNLATVSGWLAQHREIIKTVVELIAIRFIPMLTVLAAKLTTSLVLATTNAGLAFLGLSTRVGVAAAEVVAAETKIAASTAGMAGIIQKEMVTGQIAFFGLGTAAEEAALVVSGANAKMAGSAVATGATVRASSTGMVAGLANKIGIAAAVLAVGSLAWDKFGMHARTGASMTEYATQSLKVAVLTDGGAILEGLGHLSDGFGLFHNNAATSLHNTGVAAFNMADNVVRAAQIANQALGLIAAGFSSAQAAQGAWSAQHGGVSGPITRAQEASTGVPGLEAQHMAQDLKAQTEAGSAALNKLLKSGGFQSGGAALPGGGGGGSAASAAKDAAKKFVTDIKDKFKDLGKHVSAMSADQIKSTFDGLIKLLIDHGNKSLAKATKAVEKTLIKDANKLAALKDKLSAEMDFGKQLKQTIRDMGSVATATEGIGTTFTGIANRMRFAVSQSAQFAAVMEKLKALKLNDVAISQLAAAGPASLANAQAILGGGKAGVDQLNGLQTQLDKNANGIITQTADSYFKAGQSVAEGFLKGLQSQEKALEATMDKLADKLVARIKKALGIKSPSRVFADLGSHVAGGFAQGIISGSRKVNAASNNMVNASTNFGPGSVVVNGAPGDPMQAGILTGRGITSVLERQRTQAVLKGVG